MKRYGYLWDQVCSLENIAAAHDKARKGKAHYSEVKMVESDRETFFGIIRDLLLSKSFRNAPYEIMTRKEGDKVREIWKLPYFPDRVVHHCIVRVMEPIWMRSLIRDTFAAIPGRGVHDGVKRVKHALRNDPDGTRYCLKLDVRKFYRSIDHDVLLEILGQKIKDADLLWLLEEIVRSAPGVPIGNFTSQWFGNLYLSGLDHWVKEELRVRHYFRYCDDMVLLADDKSDLHELRREVEGFLRNRLRLELKKNWQVFPVDVRGIDFLGYRFFRRYTLVRKRIVKRFKRTLKRGNREKALAAYYGWFKHANTYHLRRSYGLRV